MTSPQIIYIIALLSAAPLFLNAMEGENDKSSAPPFTRGLNNLESNTSPLEVPPRKINAILSELRLAMLEEEESKKANLKRSRINLGNTKQIIISNFHNFIGDLEIQINGPETDIASIKKLLENQKDHLLALGRINGISLEYQDESKEEAFSSEDPDILEGEECDIQGADGDAEFEDFLNWDLPEKALLWINHAYQEKDLFWKGLSLRRALEVSEGCIRADQEKKMGNYSIKYFLEAAENFEDLKDKANALFKAADLARKFEWADLEHGLYKEAISSLRKKSNSVPYQRYSDDKVPSALISPEEHPLGEVQVILKQIADTEYRSSMAQLLSTGFVRQGTSMALI